MLKKPSPQQYDPTDGAPYCLVHVRRKFAEIVKAAGGDAACEGADSVALEACRRIDRIFRVDSKFDRMSPERRKAARDERLGPLMESFREWAEAAIGKAVPGLALHRALAYTLKCWPYEFPPDDHGLPRRQRRGEVRGDAVHGRRPGTQVLEGSRGDVAPRALRACVGVPTIA